MTDPPKRRQTWDPRLTGDPDASTFILDPNEALAQLSSNASVFHIRVSIVAAEHGPEAARAVARGMLQELQRQAHMFDRHLAEWRWGEPEATPTGDTDG